MKNQLCLIRLALCLTLCLALMQWSASAARADEPPAPGRLLIRAGHVLDVRNGNETADQTIIVSGDLISGIAATGATPKLPQDREIDLRGMTLLPGLIDVHT